MTAHTTPDIQRLRRQLAETYPLTDRTLTLAGQDWTLSAVENQDALLDCVQTDADLDHFPYGLLLWASAVGLAERLAEEPGLVAGRRILELGAGVGLPGLAARHLGGSVTQTDYQRAALRLAQINAAQNGLGDIAYVLADWRDFQHAGLYDVVLGSDVLYERTLHRDLERVVARVLAPHGLLLLSDPLRPQAMEFIARLENSHWKIALESRPVVWEGETKEIALFFARRPGE